MTYESVHDIPGSVKIHVPYHAQRIYLKAFNSAWSEYSKPNRRRGRKKESQEQVAHKVAWAAVKKKYRKKGGRWVLGRN